MFSRQRAGAVLQPTAGARSVLSSQQAARGNTSVWERFVALAPQGPDASVTYRVGRPAGYQCAARQHPYSQDPPVKRTADSSARGAASVGGYYELLGVPRDAGIAEIERAYRQIVARIHPDKFSHDRHHRDVAEQTLRQLNHAMQVLRDPVQRAAYDRRPERMLSAPPLARRLDSGANRYLIDRGERPAPTSMEGRTSDVS